MKTQISRMRLPDPENAGTFRQQGRVLLDADANENTLILRGLAERAVADVIGARGAPRAGGLGVFSTAPGILLFHPGRLYADGIAGNFAGSGAPELDFFITGQRDLKASSEFLPLTDFVVYADLWRCSVTALEDTEMLDPALHGADTDTREQTLAQLKLHGDPAFDPDDPNQCPRIGDARLTVRQRGSQQAFDPCDPCAQETKLPSQIGNYLFRLEVHDVQGEAFAPTELTLKWSDENGAEEARVGQVPGDFKLTDRIYEFFSADTEKHLGLPSALGTLRSLLRRGYPDDVPPDLPFVRRWDGFAILKRSSAGVWSLFGGFDRGIALVAGGADVPGQVLFGSAAKINLESLALELTLEGKPVLAGDFWPAAIREAAVPQDGVWVKEAAPAGIEHHYALVARVDENGVLLEEYRDRRQALSFPSLTSLDAGDIDYQAPPDCGLFSVPSLPQASADTVQKALDRLCSLSAADVPYRPGSCDLLPGQPGSSVQDALDEICRHSAGCEVVIGPRGRYATLDDALDALWQDRQAIQLCFCLLPGVHPVRPRLLRGVAGSHLSIHGCGPASVLKLGGGTPPDWTLEGFGSVRLAHLGLELEPGTRLVVQGGQRVAFESLAVSAWQTAGARIVLDATQTIRLSNNEIRLQKSVFQTPIPFPDPTLLQDLPAVAAVAALLGPTDAASGAAGQPAEETPAEVGRRLADLPAAERSRRAKVLRASLDGAAGGGLDAEQHDRLKKLATALAARRADPERLGGILDEPIPFPTTVVPAPDGLVLAIVPRGNDVYLTGNRIVGVTSIYDYTSAGDSKLTPNERRVLRSLLLLEFRPLRLKPAQGRLAVQGNRLSRLAVGTELVQRLRDLVNQTGPFVVGTGEPQVEASLKAEATRRPIPTGPILIPELPPIQFPPIEERPVVPPEPQVVLPGPTLPPDLPEIPIPPSNFEVGGAFAVATLTDNVFELDSCLVVARDVSMTGNAIKEVNDDFPANFSVVVAHSSFYSGNFASQDFIDNPAGLVDLSLRSNVSLREQLNYLRIGDF